MTPFEEQLKQALARREPPQDFTARVLEAVSSPTTNGPPAEVLPGSSRWAIRPAWALRFASAIAALLLITGVAFYREHEETVRGEAAKQQLLTAVRIAGSKLYRAQQHVLEIQQNEVDQ